MTLGEAILRGESRAVGQLADIIRAHGGTYRDTVERVQHIYRKAGRDVPDEGTIDGWLYEADDEEGRR